ncbi:hypothetical protein CTRI78_v010429 [Colletotrichum trifolii]|uniref:Uncharacterized protein n=1 Tax=Colletotrichum trifolii TaxID=5466 RepID=A0A4R8QT89_COLTR|nr:hypothetical protein CTRI78_v010429 [Colletotrichum trifolii]
MARTIYPRVVVEKAPSHDGKPCYTAWTIKEFNKDVQTPLEEYAPGRPVLSVQIYETSPLAENEEHVRAVAQNMEEITSWDRESTSRSHPTRIEVHGLSQPKGMSKEERVQRCIEHQRAEISARMASGANEFYIPVFYHCRGWEYMLLVVNEEKPTARKEVKKDCFLAVMFNLDPDAKQEDPDHPSHSITSYDTTEEMHYLWEELPSLTSGFSEDHSGIRSIHDDLEKRWQWTPRETDEDLEED